MAEGMNNCMHVSEHHRHQEFALHDTLCDTLAVPALLQQVLDVRCCITKSRIGFRCM